MNTEMNMQRLIAFGTSFYIEKVGRKWKLHKAFGTDRLFDTKKEAKEFAYRAKYPELYGKN